MPFSENWQPIADYELIACGPFLEIPPFISQGTFLLNRLKIEFYADACDMSASGKDSADWESGIGIGGIIVVNGEAIESPCYE